jgi:plastocyanin
MDEIADTGCRVAVRSGILGRRAVLGAMPLAVLLFATITARADDAEVTIDNFTFTPGTLTVKVGTRVVLKNQDDVRHLVVSDMSPPLFRSKVLDTDGSFSTVFDKPGTYHYFCGLHPHMQGTIVVQ